MYSTSDAPENQVIRLDDPQSGQWTAVPKPPLSLQGVRLVAAGTDVLVVGQTTTGNNGECNVLHILDNSASDNSWRELPAAPATNRADTVAVWTGSELFIGGGDACDNGVATGELINRVSLLNPNTGARTCRSGAIVESSAWSSVSEPPSATISPFFPIATQVIAKRFECWVHGVRVAAGPRTSLSDSPVKRPGDGSVGWCCQSLDGGGGIRLTGFG